MSRRQNMAKNWSVNSRLPTAPRPQGLRGKDIGLYYRDLQRAKKTDNDSLKEKDIIIDFAIPPAVITKLNKNIEAIKELAFKSNIQISPFTGLSFIKLEPEEEKTDFCSSSSGSNSEFLHPSQVKIAKKHSENSPNTSSFSANQALDLKDIKTEENNKTAEDVIIKTDGIEGVYIKIEPMEVASEENSYSAAVETIKSEPMEVANNDNNTPNRILSLRGAGDFKYGYEDIITGSFDEKLNECLSKGVKITKQAAETDNLSVALYEDYKSMLLSNDYKKHLKFRETLPTYKKSKEFLEVLENNQVLVISGETGCGKSTQIPQLILDDALRNKRGGYINILVTQPRRIAASSLAIRVAAERGESLGASVGYAVRLEKVDARPRGSIMFFTTGVLLATLEIDQGLTKYTHIILDEVHERDCDIDLAMFMLKKVLQKRKDLKLILMSATIDADTLSHYFDNCPMLHIEGLAYPVTDIYLEKILDLTKFQLPEEQEKKRNNTKPWHRYVNKKYNTEMEKSIQYKAEIGPWLQSVKKELSGDVYLTLQDYRIEILNVDLILELLLYICKGPAGAILVFLPGIAEISKLLGKMEKSKRFSNSEYQIYPLHSKLPTLQQHKIFDRPPGNIRKIIVATNIAETSITIDDIVYVIDSGRIKYNGLNVEQNISTLQIEWVSQANLRQRRGRAGRCQPGICYHLLTSYRTSKLEERLLPELQRSSLLEPVLSIKRLRLGNAAEAFSLMPAPPADSTVKSAVQHLQQCRALDLAEKLTPLGWHLARLPVHPAAGKLLLLGALFGCLDRAASVAAVWGFKDPFQLVIGKEDEVDQTKKGFALGEGSDHVAISEAIIQWENMASYHQRKQFAYFNYLSNNNLELLSDMKTQFADTLKRMGFLPSGNIKSDFENRNVNNMSLFKAVIAASLYPNVATTRWMNMRSRNPNKQVRVKGRTAPDGYVNIHPGSVLAVKPPKRGGNQLPICDSPGASWLVYWHKQRSSELYLIEVTLVHTLPLLFFGELTVTEGENPDECFILMSSIKVRCKKSTTELLCQLRSLLDQVLASKIGTSSSHSTRHNEFEEQILNAVKDLITAEDEQALNLYDDNEEYSESDSSEYESNRPWRK